MSLDKLVIISHTEHYKTQDGIIVGWGPTINEINYLATIFDAVTHIAPLHTNEAPKSSLSYVSKIKFVALKPSGGKGLRKLSILSNAFSNLNSIRHEVSEATIIQFRAPTGIGLYVLPWLRLFNSKPYWVKYAGNWVASEMPLGNRLQRLWLKHCITKQTKVTINGNWSELKRNFVAFENPCLTIQDRIKGQEAVNMKETNDTCHYCFVGGLSPNKGVQDVIEVFQQLNHIKLGELHIVGDGSLRKQLEQQANSIKGTVVFHGFLSKDKIGAIYKKCHFIVLPSRGEGFPKVIGEAMNYGCVPIVSAVSCIPQYITPNINGFLIDPLSLTNLKSELKKSLILNSNDFKNFIFHNYELAHKFTYDYYIDRVQKEIVV